MAKNIRWICLLLLFGAVVSCFKDDNFNYSRNASSGEKQQASREDSDGISNTMLMVSAGFNSLSEDLRTDLLELSENYLPDADNFSSNRLIILERLSSGSRQYSTPVSPVLYHMYNNHGTVVRDTLKIWPEGTPICKGSGVIREALELVRSQFPSKSYGMVFSSHASGWLPEGYYNDPGKYEGGGFCAPGLGKSRTEEVFPPIEPFPAVKSIGQDIEGSGFHEMELKDLAQAIPFTLDYLLLDACLCGCVEVAWELKGKANLVGFSQTEVLSDGFDYTKITESLLGGTPDPVKVCSDYFEMYNSQPSSRRCATISVIDTRKMDELATLCTTLFEKYRSNLDKLNGYSVQGYFRFNRHFFYDLKDILVKAGINAGEQQQLDAALDKCLLYKAATPTFLSIDIKVYSGLSMFLPSMGSDFLKSFYKENIAWNSETALVK